ncbi:MAG: hypothetical protein HY869_06790 [Chloroflexi bacterium]|nr:hypothetical protein [Chloroflexota bacterium]
MKKLAFPFLIFTLALASLACTVFIGGPDYPTEAIPVSTEAAQSIQDQVKQAIEAGALTGTATFQINESQLTSYLTYKLQSQADPFMTEPKIFLRDGQMQVFGKVQRGMFAANVAIVLGVGIDENGAPSIQVISADFGPFDAPEGLNDAISKLVNEAYTGSLGPVATGFRLQSITIADGLMTVSGQIK